jgi:exodeoxyribonuclease VII small subunit
MIGCGGWIFNGRSGVDVALVSGSGVVLPREGGLSLDVSLKKFEEGIGLAQRCEKALSSAEKKIEKLTRSAGGKLKTEPLDDSDEDDEEDDFAEADDEEDEDGELLF